MDREGPQGGSFFWVVLGRFLGRFWAVFGFVPSIASHAALPVPYRVTVCTPLDGCAHLVDRVHPLVDRVHPWGPCPGFRAVLGVSCSLIGLSCSLLTHAMSLLTYMALYYLPVAPAGAPLKDHFG